MVERRLVELVILWSHLRGAVPSSWRNPPSFFSQPDGAHAMVAKRLSMRTIFHCPPSQATCEQINLYHYSTRCR